MRKAWVFVCFPVIFNTLQCSSKWFELQFGNQLSQHNKYDNLMPFEDIGISWKGLSHRPNDGSGFGHICPTSLPPMESSLPSSKHSPANSITIVVIKIIYKKWSGFDVFQVSKTLMLLREEGNDCTSGPERKYANWQFSQIIFGDWICFYIVT